MHHEGVLAESRRTKMLWYSVLLLILGIAAVFLLLLVFTILLPETVEGVSPEEVRSRLFLFVLTSVAPPLLLLIVAANAALRLSRYSLVVTERYVAWRFFRRETTIPFSAITGITRQSFGRITIFGLGIKLRLFLIGNPNEVYDAIVKRLIRQREADAPAAEPCGVSE